MGLEIETTTAKVKIKDATKVAVLEVYDSKNVKDSELSFKKQSSPKNDTCWRLIYKAKKNKALEFFKASGPTLTSFDLFCGSKKECLDFMDEQKMDVSKIKAHKLEKKDNE